MPDLTQEIHNYAMESDDNLIVFVQTARSFDKLRKKLISGFAQKLEEKLKQKYPIIKGWIVDDRTLIENPLKMNSLLTIRHELWPQDLKVGIGMQKLIYYGIYWRDYKSHHPKRGRDIFELMNNNFGRSRSDKFFPWFIQNEEGFGDWFREEALVSMRQVIRGNPPEDNILEFFYGKFVNIIEPLGEYLKPVAGPGH